ncbi:Cytoplasmic tRNA 2-thiolation protein 2 [Halocaridina rubra]|uniref:Cytoplasmic tRNA 2-thiolation protein 2 n=1 Tax=Halocaridina rubra TaxID=373956 RepID=A0AAN9A7W3_HALRR
MCSVDPDEVVEMSRIADTIDLSSGNVLCRKCDTERAVVVLRLKDVYCKMCFLSYFVHKFRSTIGKSKQIRPGDHVLIATSGGPSSMAMLHLVRDGLNETSHKKLRFQPAFLYIDESCLSHSLENGPDLVQKICFQVAALKFPCYFISLEKVMSLKFPIPTLYKDDSKTSSVTTELKEDLKKLLSSCKSETAQQDLLLQLRQEIYYQCAKALGYQKIFLGDNATTLSISILANVALGRGSQLADRVHFKTKYKDVEVFRPLREILLNEITYYNNLNNISTLQIPTLRLKGKSITACTEDFVMGLQKEFPATIPTIFRTGDKLISTLSDTSKCSTPDLNGRANGDTSYHLCALCGLNLDTIQSDSSAVNATLVSQNLSAMDLSGNEKSDVTFHKTDLISTNISDNSSNTEKSSVSACCKTNSEACGSEKKSSCCQNDKRDFGDNHRAEVSKETVQRYLCYGCRIIVREMSEVGHLPIKVRNCVNEQERHERMREQIKDFLI